MNKDLNFNYSLSNHLLYETKFNTNVLLVPCGTNCTLTITKRKKKPIINQIDLLIILLLSHLLL